MKYLFLTLFLLNVLYALWQLQAREPMQPDPAVERVVDVPPRSSEPTSEMSGASARQAPNELLNEPVAALCVTLGRFDDPASAEQLRQRMLALDIAAEVKPKELVVGTDYWLVMPVVGGEHDAVLQLSALQEQGVDSFLISRGDMAGQLSLGVFTREDDALLRRERLQELGHEVNVHALSRLKPQFLVEVSGDGRRLVDQAMLTRLRADFPSLQHQYQPCTKIANGPRIP